MATKKQESTYKRIKQDINMLEYPLWMQDEKLPSKISEDKGFVWKDREGYLYRCGYKVPTKLDIIYLMYLLYRSQQEGWKEEIELSRYEILKSCGYNSCRPADYERLEDSLERWKMVGVKFQGTFYDGKKYIALSFGVIDTWKIDENTKKLKVRFNHEWLMRIKNSSYFKYLNFDQIRSLRSPLAMRLYEILVKSFQGRGEWIIDAQKLAQKIPMKEKAVAHILPKIKAAVNRINNKTNLKVSLIINRPQRGKAILKFKAIEGQEEPQIIEQIEPILDISLDKLMSLVPEKHRKKKTVRELIVKFLRKKGEEFVERNILYTNEQIKNARSYRIFLKKSLEEDWAREWWEDKNLEREKEERLKQDTNLRETIEKKLKNLSLQERKKLEKRAKEELPEGVRDIPSFVRMQMRLILKRELAVSEN